MSGYRWMTCAYRCRGAVERQMLPVLPILSCNGAVKTCPDHRCYARLHKFEDVGLIKSYHMPICQSFSSSSSRGAKNKKQSSSSSSSSSSSDDDKKPRKKGQLRGQSEFWRKKMRTHHMAIDLNKDGVVSWDDFEILIKNFALLGNLKSKDVDKLTSAMKHVWEEEWGASGDPYAFIGQEQFLSSMEHAINTKDLRKKMASPLPYLFKAIDWDNSGTISIEEFKTFFKCLRLSEEAATEAFNTIDLNGDGILSMHEFHRLGRDFFLSEDEATPGKLFWGPLFN